MPQTDFFGPDLGRGPFTSTRIETAAIQIAAALAQQRAPLLRNDDDIRAHVDYIRELADRLAPDYASQVFIDVGAESSNSVSTLIRVQPATYSLLHCWLADDIGGGESATFPGSITFLDGYVVKELTSKANYIVVTSSTGVIRPSVTYTGSHNWRWGVARYGRAYYSDIVRFT